MFHCKQIFSARMMSRSMLDTSRFLYFATGNVSGLWLHMLVLLCIIHIDIASAGSLNRPWFDLEADLKHVILCYNLLTAEEGWDINEPALVNYKRMWSSFMPLWNCLVFRAIWLVSTRFMEKYVSNLFLHDVKQKMQVFVHFTNALWKSFSGPQSEIPAPRAVP